MIPNLLCRPLNNFPVSESAKTSHEKSDVEAHKRKNINKVTLIPLCLFLNLNVKSLLNQLKCNTKCSITMGKEITASALCTNIQVSPLNPKLSTS